MSFFQGHFHDKLIMERLVLIFGVLMFLTFTVKNYAGKHFPPLSMRNLFCESNCEFNILKSSVEKLLFSS